VGTVSLVATRASGTRASPRDRTQAIPFPACAVGDVRPGRRCRVIAASLSETQRRIVTALCRPYKHDDPYATPASNQQIADELFLSVDAVKTHLRTLIQKFQMEGLPQSQKRVKLVERAVR
jgi:hypothetical protein